MRPFVCLLGMLALLTLAVLTPLPAMSHEILEQPTLQALDDLPTAYSQSVTFASDAPRDVGRPLDVGDLRHRSTHYISWHEPIQKSDTPCQKNRVCTECGDKCRRHPLHTLGKCGKHVVAGALAWRPLRGKCRGGCCRGSCC